MCDRSRPWPDLLLFGWIPPIEGRARTGGAHEQLSAIRERDVPAVRATDRTAGVILRHESLDDHLAADHHRLLGETALQQTGRGTTFDHPLLDGAVRLLHIDMEPRVGVDPFHARDGSLQLDWLVRVEFRRKRVMRLH